MHKILRLIMIFDIHTVASSKISVSWNVTLHCSVARRHPPNELSDVTFQNILKSREQFLACFTPFLDILTQKPTHISVLQILFTLAFFFSSVSTALSSSNRPFFVLFIYDFWYFSFKKQLFSLLTFNSFAITSFITLPIWLLCLNLVQCKSHKILYGVIRGICGSFTYVYLFMYFTQSTDSGIRTLIKPRFYSSWNISIYCYNACLSNATCSKKKCLIFRKWCQFLIIPKFLSG